MFNNNVFGQKIGFNRTDVSQPSFDAAKKIYDLANGLTHEQFVTAMKIALEDVEANLTLVCQPVQQSHNQSNSDSRKQNFVSKMKTIKEMVLAGESIKKILAQPYPKATLNEAKVKDGLVYLEFEISGKNEKMMLHQDMMYVLVKIVEMVSRSATEDCSW